MDDIKKNDKQPLFPHQELVTKPGNELWMLWETKILASLTGNFPNQVGWMLNAGLDEKKPPWGLKMVPDFNQGYDDLDFRYHPGPNPMKKHYRNLPIPPDFKGEFRFRSTIRSCVSISHGMINIVRKKPQRFWNFKKLKAGFSIKCVLRLRKQIW